MNARCHPVVISCVCAHDCMPEKAYFSRLLMHIYTRIHTHMRTYVKHIYTPTPTYPHVQTVQVPGHPLLCLTQKQAQVPKPLQQSRAVTPLCPSQAMCAKHCLLLLSLSGAVTLLHHILLVLILVVTLAACSLQHYLSKRFTSLRARTKRQH